MLLLVALALLLSGSAAQAFPDTKPCRAPLPRGPSVPAPIVFQTSCGAFRLAPDGEVSRLPPRWLAARQGGTGRRYGADLRVRRNRPGRIVLLRKGRVVWRSTDLYPNDAADVEFGPNTFAFSSYRRGIFVTDLEGPERLIVPGVGLYPHAFIRDGSLLVTRRRSVSVISQDGSLLRRYRFRAGNGYAFDERTESLFFVTPGRLLARAQGTRLRIVRPARDLEGWIYLPARDLLVFQGNRVLVVLRHNGRYVARASWHDSRGWTFDSGLTTSADGSTFAYRLSKTGSSRSRGKAVLYVLRAGEAKARPLYRHRLGKSGCWTGASLAWHGRFLLYSSADGQIAAFDTRNGRRTVLTELASALPHRAQGERGSAYWASGFAKPKSR